MKLNESRHIPATWQSSSATLGNQETMLAILNDSFTVYDMIQIIYIRQIYNCGCIYVQAMIWRGVETDHVCKFHAVEMLEREAGAISIPIRLLLVVLQCQIQLNRLHI